MARWAGWTRNRRSTSSSSSRPASGDSLVPAGQRAGGRARRPAAGRLALPRGRRAARLARSATSSRRTSTTTTCPARSRRGPRRGRRSSRPARGSYEFEHRPVDEGDWLEIGGLRLTAWATPGHTPEHLAWLVTEAGTSGDDLDGARAIFTGGSLLVGSVGRTDLLGPVLTTRSRADQQRSLARIADLPGRRAASCRPTASGSFCSAGPVSADRTSTIDAERLANPTFALAAAPADDFRVQALDGLGRVPDYYAHMARINRARAAGPWAAHPAAGPRSRPRSRRPPPAARRSSTRGTATPSRPGTSAAR